MSEISENPVESGYQFGLEAGRVREVTPDGVPYAVIPATAKLESLERLLPNPVIKRGHVRLDDVESFVAYVEAHADERTVIFATAQEFMAVIDYHNHNGGAVGAAGWAAHRAVLRLQDSDEFRAWFPENGAPFDQERFARHLDRNMADIVSPPGADLLELTTSLIGRVSCEFGSVSRQCSDRNFYQEVREASGQAGVKVPERIILSIPIYKHGSPYKVELRLRVSVSAKRLHLNYEILNLGKLLDAARKEMQDAVEAGTKIKCYLGALE